MAGVSNVVLVHGAWADGSSWAKLIPDLERKFANAMNAKTITLPSSHVPMLSHPAEVAKAIIEAAKAATVN